MNKETKVIFFHGLESSSKSDKAKWLANNYDAYCPDMDYNDPNLFQNMYNEVLRINPSLLIGSSMGGWFAYCMSTLTGIRTLLLNPAFHSRTMEPKVKIGNTPAHHTVVLGKNDDVIDPTASKAWIRKNGVGIFNIRMENNGHRSPLPILQKYMDSAINEEWTTETPGDTPDYSFLPEGLRDFAVPNPMASRPFQNMGVAMTVENYREMNDVISNQSGLSDEDKTFILNAANEPYDLFYRWLVIRGESPKMKDIKDMWNSEEAFNLINQMKDATKRSRPYWISADVEVIPGTESTSYSYPSGHSILAWLVAKKLGKRYPHLQDGLNHMAHRIARSRVQAGVHFPSDIQPGQSIAEWMMMNGY